MRFVKMAWLNSLSVKVLLAYVVGAVLSLLMIVATGLMVVYSQGDVLSGFDVADATRGLARELRFDGNGAPTGIGGDRIDRSGALDFEDDFNPQWIFESLKHEAGYRVLDASGKVTLSSAPDGVFWPEGGPAGALVRGRFEFENDGMAMRGATEAVERHGKVWFVQLAVSRRFMHLMYQAFALPFTGAGITLFSLVLLFVFGPCVYITLRYTLKPLRAISDSAAAISPRALQGRLQTKGVPAEIAPLVDSFNQVLERLEQGYRVQREFLAMAAHELKTPLALIRAQVELGAPTPDRQALLQDVEHMTRQVQQLLHLAEASEAQNYRLAMVDVHDVAQEAAAYLQRMANTADVRLELPRKAAVVHWEADRGALFTLLKNLLENAIQHTPPGTPVRVEVDTATLSVRDWGPGVDHEQLPLIFNRFWRGAHRRDVGAGLGLSICEEIARAHGWTLQASRADPGLRITLSSTTPPKA